MDSTFYILITWIYYIYKNIDGETHQLAAQRLTH